LEADGKSPDTRHPKPGTRSKGGESKRSADKSRGMAVLRSRLATEGGRLTQKCAVVTCPVESAAPSHEARIQQGEGVKFRIILGTDGQNYIYQTCN